MKNRFDATCFHPSDVTYFTCVKFFVALRVQALRSSFDLSRKIEEPLLAGSASYTVVSLSMNQP